MELISVFVLVLLCGNDFVNSDELSGNLEETTACNAKVREMKRCLEKKISFTAARYQAQLLDCYTEECDEKPAIAVADRSLRDQLEKCGQALHGTFFKEVKNCINNKILSEKENSVTHEIWHNSSMLWADYVLDIGNLRNEALTGNAFGVSLIPDLIKTETIFDTCGGGRKEVKTCIQYVKDAAERGFKKFWRTYVKCKNQLDDCTWAYDRLDQYFCDCTAKYLSTAESIGTRGQCAKEKFPGEESGPRKVIASFIFSLCEQSSDKVRKFRRWWEQSVY